ncbi:MAG: SDR family NAD(P)-dependent oxidoreductase [Psychroflexus sp.]|nr:SDR family NAD(P)-dependent oxidoreductase [Psychroflexus sp.]MDN6309762.1 SDR family NAD(P)-dependent oxidoreductase [Psychroflexus sp.]
MKIGILGCGWLGLPLALHLKSDDNIILGSTTQESKLTLLQEQGISPFQIQITPQVIKGQMHDFLEDLEALVIDFPPRVRSRSADLFLDEMGLLIDTLEAAQHLQKIIYVSSTSVFQNTTDFKVYDESYVFSEEDQANSALVKAELMLEKHLAERVKIIRCGGLIGPDRHPVKYLSGRMNVANPDAPVNMTYQKDAISVCQEVLYNFDALPASVFHAVDSDELTRQQFYQKAAAEFLITEPQFDHQHEQEGKRVLSTQTIASLNNSLM